MSERGIASIVETAKKICAIAPFYLLSTFFSPKSSANSFLSVGTFFLFLSSFSN
jgi:hypothetical protein